MDGGSAPLLIEVIQSTTHGKLVEYSKNGFIGYHPIKDFVGIDTFTFRVCDECSAYRNVELRGAADTMSTHPSCVREREVLGNSSEVGCLTETIKLKIVNVNDGLIAAALAGVITNADTASVTAKTAKFCAFDAASDIDDVQASDILALGLDPVSYGFTQLTLDNKTDIDISSLTIAQPPTHGTATVVHDATECASGTALLYTSPNDWLGYDVFTYTLCDRSNLCNTNSVHVRTTVAAPAIVSVKAVPVQNAESIHSDSSYGSGDSVVISFNVATNMPPHGATGQYVTSADLDQMVHFNHSFSPYSAGYHGKWLSATELQIVLDDVGDLPSTPVAAAVVTSIVTNETRCGQFDAGSDIYIPIEEAKYCITNDARTSRANVASFQGLSGTWGLLLGDVERVYVTNPEGVGTNYLDTGSRVEMMINPPLSPAQLAAHCAKGADQVLDLSNFGTGVTAKLDCGTIWTGVDPTTVVPAVINSTTSAATAASTNETEAGAPGVVTPGGVSIPSIPDAPSGPVAPGGGDIVGRNRRQVAGPAARVQSSPALSNVTIVFQNVDGAIVTPADGDAFILAVRKAWRGSTPYLELAKTVQADTLLGSIDDYMAHSSGDSPMGKYRTTLDNSPERLRALSYVNGLDKDTPKVEVIAFAGSGQSLIEISITFDRDTNIPFVAGNLGGTDYALDKAGVDQLMLFTPSLGSAYTAAWDNRRTIKISVNAVNANLTGVPSVTFRSNQDVNLVSISDPCRGSNVCGMSGTVGGTGGICDRSENSCRVSGTYTQNSAFVVVNAADAGAAKGSGASSESNDAATSSLWALLLLIIILPLIAFLAYKWYNNRKEQAHINKAKRAIRQSKIAWTGTTADGKQVPDTVDMWSRPPAMTAMRQNPDPFVFFNGKDTAVPASDKQFNARGDPFIQGPLPGLNTQAGPRQGGQFGAPQRGATQAENNVEAGQKAQLPTLKLGAPRGARPTLGAKLPPPPRQGKGKGPIMRPPGTGGKPGGFAAAAGRAAPGGGRGSFQVPGGRDSKVDLFNVVRKASLTSQAFGAPKGAQDPFQRKRKTSNPFQEATDKQNERRMSMPQRRSSSTLDDKVSPLRPGPGRPSADGARGPSMPRRPDRRSSSNITGGPPRPGGMKALRPPIKGPGGNSPGAAMSPPAINDPFAGSDAPKSPKPTKPGIKGGAGFKSGKSPAPARGPGPRVNPAGVSPRKPGPGAPGPRAGAIEQSRRLPGAPPPSRPKPNQVAPSPRISASMKPPARAPSNYERNLGVGGKSPSMPRAGPGRSPDPLRKPAGSPFMKPKLGPGGAAGFKSASKPGPPKPRAPAKTEE